jgi:hypothetical protein
MSDEDEGAVKRRLKRSLDRPRPGPLPRPKVEPGVQKQIGRDLQAMYDELVREPLPDHLSDLAQRIGPRGRKAVH